jgi:hypothetical protein
MQGVRILPSAPRIVTRTCSNVSNGDGARVTPWIAAADAVVEVVAVDEVAPELHAARGATSRRIGRSRRRGRATTLRRRCRTG